MKKAHWGWKLAAILICIFGAGDVIDTAVRRTLSLGAWAEAAALSLAAIGVLQYAFGWPKLPRLVWRIFGPVFSLVMIWPLAVSVGWLATRLAIKQLTLGEQFATAGLLALLAIYGFVVVVPLYRLGQWKHLKGDAATEETAKLRGTFA
jgi:hypothetical protein